MTWWQNDLEFKIRLTSILRTPCIKMITYLFSDFYFWTTASLSLLRPLSLALFPFVQAAFVFELEASPPCNNNYDCVTQLKLYTVDKLSSSTFCCLSVCVSGIGNTWPNLHFFQNIQAYKPFADPVPPNTKKCQLILTQYHQVPLIIHHLVTHSWANWI